MKSSNPSVNSFLNTKKTYNILTVFNSRLEIFNKNLNRLYYAKVWENQPTNLEPLNSSICLTRIQKFLLESQKPPVLIEALFEADIVHVEKEPIKSSFDWRIKGAVYRVKDLGQSVSGIAFSTAANIEWQIFL